MGLSDPVTSDWLLFFIRLIFGIIFIYYGQSKIKDLKKNASDFDSMGFKPGLLFGTPIAFLEFFASILIILGVYVELIASFFAAHMIMGTVWKQKVKKPFTDYTYDIMLLLLSLVLIVFGAGRFDMVPFEFEFLRPDILIGFVIVAVLLVFVPSMIGGKKDKVRDTVS